MTPRDFRIAASTLSFGSIGLAPVWHLVGSAAHEQSAKKARRFIARIDAGPVVPGLLATLAASIATATEGLFRFPTAPA